MQMNRPPNKQHLSGSYILPIS